MENENSYLLGVFSESEWVPVPPKKVEPKKQFVPASEPLCSFPKPVPVMVPPPTPVAAPISTTIPAILPPPSVFPQNISAEVGCLFSRNSIIYKQFNVNIRTIFKN